MSQDSGSSSECGDEVERAARNRIAQSTQEDYNHELKMIKVFAVENASTFSNCIAEGQLVEPVPFALGQAYLVHVRDAMVPWPLDPRPEATRTGLKHYSTSKMNNAISAIKYSFSKVSCPIPYVANKFYDDFRHSFKHIIARDKAGNAYPCQSGTVPLSMTATTRLLEAAIRFVPTGRGAAESSARQLWLFLLICIATCGRVERVSRIQLQCISWFADALTAQIPTSKSDTEGLMSYAKMCAANPWNPLCCIVTALGVEFVSRDASSNFQYLFGVTGAESMYTVTRLQTALKNALHVVGEENLGAPFHRLTGHFLKKTGISILRSCHECVSQDSRELRADHKVGPYNHRSDQDAIAGRMLAFLKPGSEEFSAVPPHFHPRITAAIPWPDIVPGYNLYGSTTKLAIHACVASVVHNSHFLDKQISSSHPYHGCRLRKSQARWVSLLQPYVLGGRSGFKSVMDATGHSLISNIAVDLRLVRQRGVSCCGTVLDEAVAEIAGLKQAVDRLTHAVQGCPAMSSTAESSASQTAFPIGYLPASFRFPVSISAEDCWNRWHDARNPLRAINSKMLPASMSPAERGRQMCVRRKIKGVMGIIQGQTPDKIVDLDPAFVWKACWARCVSLFCIEEPCTWAVGTLYDVLLKQPQSVKEARAAPSIAFAEAAAAAATSTAKTAKDAAVFAIAAAAHPPVRVISSNHAGISREDDAAAAVNAAAEAASDRATDVTSFVTAVATADMHSDSMSDESSDTANEAAAALPQKRNGHDTDASPFAVPIASIVANVVLQSEHAPKTTNHIVPMVEYAFKSGVRCLHCMRVLHDKSGFNRHCSLFERCRPPSFRHIHKIPCFDNEAAAAAAALFNEAEAHSHHAN
jgi:hypothetical protein